MLFQWEQLAQYGFVGVSIIIIVALGVLAYFLARHGLKVLAQREQLSESLRIVLQGFVRWIIIILVVLFALQQAGVRVSGIWAALLTVMAMVAVGLIAVWSILSNILCSLLLIIFRPFRIGDEIEIIEATGGKGLRGRVTNFNILFTFLKEINEEESSDIQVQVPNNVFFQKTVRRREGTKTESLDEYLFKKPSANRKSNE